MAYEENKSHRKFCVVWTENGKSERGFDQQIDHSQFFDENEEEDANNLYNSLLGLETTYCVSLCKILKDSEG